MKYLIATLLCLSCGGATAEPYFSLGVGWDTWHGTSAELSGGYDFGLLRLGAAAVQTEGKKQPSTYSYVSPEVGVDITDSLTLSYRTFIQGILLEYRWGNKYVGIGVEHPFKSGPSAGVVFSSGITW